MMEPVKPAPIRAMSRVFPSFSLPQLWALVVVAGIWIILNLTLVRPHDFWWHVASGQRIVELGRVPGVDLYSYTRFAEPYVYEMWLPEVAFYLLMRAGGLPLIIFFHAVTITTAYAVVLRVCRDAAGGSLRPAVLATLAAAALGVANWNVRPQTISFLFFALTLFLLERDTARPQGNGVFWLVPIMLVWANSHGGFVLGLALAGVYVLAGLLAWLAGRRDTGQAHPFPTRLLAAMVLSAAATLLTPQGSAIGAYVAGILRHDTIRNLALEWMPPTVQTWEGQLFFGFVVGLAALLLASRYRLKTHEALRLLLFGALALMARRNIAWFGMVAAPVAAACLAEWSARRGAVARTGPGRPRLNLAIASLVGLLAVASLPWLRPFLPLPAERQAYLSAETPVDAVAFLKGLPAQRAFHSEAYGSYMIWASPERPVFVDTRIELYPPTQWADYVALSAGRYDWQEILDRYGIDTLLLDRDKQGRLIEAAGASPSWARVYEDAQAVVLQRRGAP